MNEQQTDLTIETRPAVTSATGTIEGARIHVFDMCGKWCWVVSREAVDGPLRDVHAKGYCGTFDEAVAMARTAAPRVTGLWLSLGGAP